MGVGRPAVELAKLRAACERVERELERPDDELFVPLDAVSHWSPAQHVDHVVRVNEALVGTIRKLGCGFDDPRGRGGLTPLGVMMLTLRWIPRGRGKVPDSVAPSPTPTREELSKALAGSRSSLAGLEALTAMIDGVRGRSPHFVFGRLTARQWLAYAHVHTHHHVKILDDIVRARA